MSDVVFILFHVLSFPTSRTILPTTCEYKTLSLTHQNCFQEVKVGIAESNTIKRPGIRGTQVKSSVRMKKRNIHLNDYFGKFDSGNRVKGPELV